MGRFGTTFMMPQKCCLWRQPTVKSVIKSTYLLSMSITGCLKYAFHVFKAQRCEKVVLRETLHNSGSPHWSALWASFNTIKLFPRIPVVTGTVLMMICAIYCFLATLSTSFILTHDTLFHTLCSHYHIVSLCVVCKKTVYILYLFFS